MRWPLSALETQALQRRVLELESDRDLNKRVITVLTSGVEPGKKGEPLFSLIDKMFNSNANQTVHITNVSWMDAETKSVLVGGEAINEIVTNGLTSLATTEAKYQFNGQGHVLANTGLASRKLSEIFWDANLSRAQKVDKIIEELMVPNGIDALVSGQFQEMADGTVRIRPFVIFKSSKSLVTESKTFQKSEYECNLIASGTRDICQKARDEIGEIVIRLAKQA